VFLRWASVNNAALARCASDGCQQCGAKSFRLRHDEKFNNVRFYCSSCGFETSFHVIHPKQSLKSIEVYDARGILIGVKKLDDYHEKTSRENADARVIAAEQKLDLGGEWFDGVSGVSSQSRYMTRQEILKKIEDRKMKRLMRAALEEIEQEQQEERASSIKTEIHGDKNAG
jgi:RNase P subunit RPR2